MNSSMIFRLITKDWSLWKQNLWLYVVGTIFCLALAMIPNEKTFYAASIILITIVIGCGAHLIFELIVEESSKDSERFIMSLPISRFDYATGKSIAVISIFGLIWLLIATGSVVVILASPGLPNGLIPFVLLILLQLFLGFASTYAVAICTKMNSWTVVVMVANNVFINFFIALVGGMPGMADLNKSNSVHFASSSIVIVLTQVCLIIVLFGIGLCSPFLRRSNR